MSHRDLDAIKDDIARVKAQIKSLPDSVVAMGLDEDYMDDLGALEDELVSAEKALDAKI